MDSDLLEEALLGPDRNSHQRHCTEGAGLARDANACGCACADAAPLVPGKAHASICLRGRHHLETEDVHQLIGLVFCKVPLHVSCSSPSSLIAHSESRQILRHFPYITALFGSVILWPKFTSRHDFPSGGLLHLEIGVLSFRSFARYGAHMQGSPEWCLVLQNDPTNQIQGGPLPVLSRVIIPFVWVIIPGTNL